MNPPRRRTCADGIACRLVPCPRSRPFEHRPASFATITSTEALMRHRLVLVACGAGFCARRRWLGRHWRDAPALHARQRRRRRRPGSGRSPYQWRR
ncbi:hypothetical protein B7H26_20095 [Stenotrophomonas maltophilia]|nr:hypothetical protein B7H26_20095 [Stenotrophomonas maltophilia]OWQ73031.1 hypothetical protein CEE56_08145 [Stenotrophomonas maltophilia]